MFVSPPSGVPYVRLVASTLPPDVTVLESLEHVQAVSLKKNCLLLLPLSARVGGEQRGYCDGRQVVVDGELPVLMPRLSLATSGPRTKPRSEVQQNMT